MEFQYTFNVGLYDTDAAGVLFFAHLFRHAHDAYEKMMREIGHPLDKLITGGHLLLPLTQAHAEYRHPIHHGDDITVSLRVLELREHSFSLAYRFINMHGNEVATARTVHVATLPGRATAVALPAELRQALSPYCPR